MQIGVKGTMAIATWPSVNIVAKKTVEKLATIPDAIDVLTYAENIVCEIIKIECSIANMHNPATSS